MRFKELRIRLDEINLPKHYMEPISKPDPGFEQDDSGPQDKLRDLQKKEGDISPLYGDIYEGSSRAYVGIKDPHKYILDEKPVSSPTGLKFVKRPDPEIHDAMERLKKYGVLKYHSLGQMQNKAENGKEELFGKYRVITKNRDGSYSSNPNGLLPPLYEHDDAQHLWSHVGESRPLKNRELSDITRSPELPEFKRLTKHELYPEGISLDDLSSALTYAHKKRNKEEHNYFELRNRNVYDDLLENHPFIKALDEFHEHTKTPPHDLSQQANWGVWRHPTTGKNHLVVVDHGFSPEAKKVYTHLWKATDGSDALSATLRRERNNQSDVTIYPSEEPKTTTYIPSSLQPSSSNLPPILPSLSTRTPLKESVKKKVVRRKPMDLEGGSNPNTVRYTEYSGHDYYGSPKKIVLARRSGTGGSKEEE